MLPIPIRDENPTTKTPVVTIALIAINIAVWLFELNNGRPGIRGVDESTLDYGAIPFWVLHGMRDGSIVLDHVRVQLHQEVPWPWTVVTSMFMHGGWLHIIGNLWFLWIFGDNVEEAMGRARYLIFYLVCGIGAAMTQILATPASTAPMVGASGAIFGVLGAYLVLFPRARIKCLWILIIFITTIHLPAWLILALYFVAQFFIGQGEGVASLAHVGGFVLGALLVLLFAQRRARLPPPPPARPAFYN